MCRIGQTAEGIVPPASCVLTYDGSMMRRSAGCSPRSATAESRSEGGFLRGFAAGRRRRPRSEPWYNPRAETPRTSQKPPAPAAARWYAAHPDKRPTLAFEAAGRPSKMITLRALTVLSRVG